jgi:hypothetical protein
MALGLIAYEAKNGIWRAGAGRSIVQRDAAIWLLAILRSEAENGF